MNLLPRRHFKEKEGREDEHEKKHAVFDRALDITVRVQDRQELRAEKRIRNRAVVLKRSLPFAARPLIADNRARNTRLSTWRRIRPGAPTVQPARIAPRNPGSAQFDFSVASFCTPKGAKKIPSLPLKSSGIENWISLAIGLSSAKQWPSRRWCIPEAANRAAAGASPRPNRAQSRRACRADRSIAIVTNASFHCTSFRSILSAPKSGAPNFPDRA